MKLFNTYFLPKNNVYSTRCYKGQIEDRYTGIKSYNGVVNDFKKDEFTLIYKEFSFVGIKLGVSKKELLRNLGIPKATINISVKDDVQILYYKHKIAQERARAEFHFFEKKLFYISVKFSSRDNRGTNDLVKVLESKYGGSLSSGEVKLKNNLNNSLIIRNNLGVSLNYMSMNTEFMELLKAENLVDKDKVDEVKEMEHQYLYNNL